MGSDDVQHRQVGTAMQGATPWSCRACVAECDLWRDLGAQCRWIRCVDRLDGDMPMRILRPLPKWSHDGSAVGTAVGSLTLKSVLTYAGCFLSLSPDFYTSVIARIASQCTLRILSKVRGMKTKCGVQYEVGPCRTLAKHLDKAGTDCMIADCVRLSTSTTYVPQ